VLSKSAWRVLTAFTYCWFSPGQLDPGFIAPIFKNWERITMKKKASSKLKYTKETPEARYRRASSGVKFRAVVFEDKRRKLRENAAKNEETQ
jgi:hypothetical protein